MSNINFFAMQQVQMHAGVISKLLYGINELLGYCKGGTS